jgi:ligand-binding sensor domain-containing protein
MQRHGTRWRVAISAAIAVGVGLTALLWWETSHAVRQARARVQAESTIRFTVRPVDRPLSANLDPIAPPAVFRDAAIFHGHFYLAGPLGMTEYDANGALVRRLRAGLELPAAGITSLAVGALAGASEPELMAGTAGEGLLVLDNRRTRQMRPDRAGHRALTATLALGAGRLLLGTEKLGVLVYDGRQVMVAHPALANVPVTALAGVEGDVWIGTLDRGVLHWRAGEVDRFDESTGLPDARVLSIVVAEDRAYVGTAVGVAEFRAGQYARTLGSGLFASALAVRRDTLIIGTLDETVAQIPLSARSSRGVRPIVQDAPGVIQRFIEADGGLYALTEDAVYAVDERTIGLRRVIGPDRAQLTDRNVSALAVDKTGRLWVGYFDRGLDILDSNGERAAHVENARVFCVNRIVHDANGGLTAVATANGLVLFDSAGHQKQVLGRAEGLIADHVTDLAVNADRITVATPAGLTFIDPDGSRSLYAFHGLVNNHVYALGTSGTQVLAGTLGGISILDNGAIQTNYTAANSALTHNWITAVARVGDEWFVGTYGGGLFHLDANGRWRPFADAAGPIEINPNALAVTDTHVFAGTLSQGLLVYDRQSMRWTTLVAGLPSMNVTALAAGRGSVYVGTDNGIVRLNEEAFVRP